MLFFQFLVALISKMIHPSLSIGEHQSFPRTLSNEEEYSLFVKMKEENSEDARQKLILHNLRLVAHIVKKYYSSSKNQDDLVSVGTLGLIKAVDTFDHKNGAKFATYAGKCIQNEILMNFRSEKKNANQVSINETIDIDRDGNPLTYIDVICCDEDMTERIDRKIMAERALYHIKHNLTEREREIILLRFGLGGRDEMTQREIAEMLGISRSYVSRIEKSAIQKLRDSMSVTPCDGS